MKVLVTGATSLLGVGVARALAGRGDEVTVLQRRPSGLQLREVLGDIADRAAVMKAVTGQQAVVHLAAKVNVTGTWPEYRRTNIDGTAMLVQACRSSGVERLVHVSSPSVAHAGSALIGVDAEPADPGRARGWYAQSKAAAEQLALAADGTGLHVVALRPHLVWGPGDTQLVARIVERARAGRLPLIGSGAALVDSTYLDNGVAALVAALDRSPAAHGQPLVVSNGEPRPVAELLAAICAAAGVPPPRRRVPKAVALAAGAAAEGLWWVRERAGRPGPGDPPITRFVAEQLATAHWFDQRRTREVLQWTPQVSIDEGLQKLTRWYAAHRPRSG